MPVNSSESYFKSIALALSGGGARAAGFHVGTMLYLDRIDLLRHVTILSSVSGGSFVNAKYALTLKQDSIEATKRGQHCDPHESFQRFYSEFRNYMLNSDLVFAAFQSLGRRRPTANSVRHATMITAIADVYDKSPDFLQGQKFGIFWEDGDIHLKHIIFNVTEFKSGLSFRFMKCADEDEKAFDQYSGTAKIPLPIKIAKDIRLGDIVAASSCIPVGLEPIVFPDDFIWPDPDLVTEIKRYLHETCGVDSVPMMDGGINDNQGIDSVLFAIYKSPESVQEFRKVSMLTARIVSDWAHGEKAAPERAKDADLIIISDTPVPNTNILRVGKAAHKRGLTIENVEKLFRVLVWLGLLTFGASFYQMAEDIESREFGIHWIPFVAQQWGNDFVLPAKIAAMTFFYINPMLLSLILVAGILVLKRQIIAIHAQIEGAFGDPDCPTLPDKERFDELWRNLRHLRINQVIEMISMRVVSLVALTTQVFFNRVRALNYSLIEFNKRLHVKVIAHEIFDLVAIKKQRPEIEPTDQMFNIVKQAANMGTTLWFKSEEEINCVVAAGAITMCYNLIDYLLEHKDRNNPAYNELLKAALADWDLLKRDAHAFVSAQAKPAKVAKASV